LPIGQAQRLQAAGQVDIWAIGTMVADAEQLAAQLLEHGIQAGVVNARFAKPLDTERLVQSAQTTKLIVTMEDHVLNGGFGTAVMEALQEENVLAPVERIGWPDTFVEHGSSVRQLREANGLGAEQILAQVMQRMRRLAIEPSIDCIPTQ
jgi:1-deoxy-D-xylulose-5-phosphate synthase